MKLEHLVPVVPGVATCLRCWARELLEWTWEANTSTPQKGL